MTPDQRYRLGEIISTKREQLGLSAAEVGRRAGVNTATVTRIEQGQFAAPTPESVRAIGTVLGLPTSDLFAVTGWVPKKELPTFRPYLRTKYDMPPEAMRELEAKFDELSREYGLDFDKDSDGPMNGEDEAPM